MTKINKLKILKNLNLFLAIIVALFSFVATFNIVAEISNHGSLEWIEYYVENSEIKQKTQNASSMLIMLFFLYLLFMTLLANFSFMGAVYLEDTKKREPNKNSTENV